MNVEKVILHTTVKDGCDGMGEVSIYKEKDFKMLPDKAFRFSFCIVKIEAVHQGTKVWCVYWAIAKQCSFWNQISDENNQMYQMLFAFYPLKIKKKC